MSSTRFPGKVLERIGGLSCIELMYRRVALSKTVDRVVIVTSLDPSDDVFCDELKCLGLEFYRGDLDDVLGRFFRAACNYDCETVVRLTGDCPLVDPEIIDQVIALRLQTGAEYASNVSPPTFPDGMDVEVFSIEALSKAHANAKCPKDREHVTLWMRKEEANLSSANLSSDIDYSKYRLTIDYEQDLQMLRALVGYLEIAVTVASLRDIVDVLNQHNELGDMNKFVRNEALL